MKSLNLRRSAFVRALICRGFVTCIISIAGFHVNAQTDKLYKVLTLSGLKQGAADIPQDQGMTGIWQKLLKLKTTASVLHTQAHPDDEHADLLTWLSRGKGVRTALLSLNRGESGGNVLGVESFDQLGLLRTEEFLLVGTYYGLDDLYFTNLADYGFSKRVEEAYEKWGKQKVLAEMVRVIRINRPLVIISRFHGSPRDGHGNHQAAGEISQEAFKQAADPSAFPEQISKEGLHAWKALKFYRGGVKADEHWNIALNTGEYSPWLGQSYKNFASLGYSFHRSQNGGFRSEVTGSSVQYYERLQSRVKSNEKESSFFDGIDTSIGGIFKITGETPSAGIAPLLKDITSAVDNAISLFAPGNPAGIIPHLTTGLSKTRAAIQLVKNAPEALFMLKIKEQQFIDAINTATGVHLQAVAVPLATKEKRGFYEPQPTMGLAVAGQPFKVEVSFANNSAVPVITQSIKIVSPPDWKIDSNAQNIGSLQEHQKKTFTVTIPENTNFSQPYFSRASLQESQYDLHDKQYQNLPHASPPLLVSAAYLINNEPVEIKIPVQVSEANLPFGYDKFTLKTAPAIAVNVQPQVGIIPVNSQKKSFNIHVELINNYDGKIAGKLNLKTPPGWHVQPEQTAFSFTAAGQKNNYSINISFPSIQQKKYEIQAIATANGKSFTQGYKLSSHRDLDQTLLYHPAVTMVKGIDVKIAPGLTIGYVMGVGDEVPAGLEQLGASVYLLNTSDLSAGRLDKYDAIMIGTRAYAVRQDLNTYNQRLLDYAKNGGNLIVLFQTPEFVPDRQAVYSAELPGNSEEISEENSPVKMLIPTHRVLNYPNKISSADFDNWVEQRGSKFFSRWDSAYTPVISTQDVGQSPQSGGWLMAKYGKGNYTYCAYAFHRQLPYGVAGAYRIIANLVSYGEKLH
jgi:LmbE family N-acetylglucosaminyl deacetylase